MRHCFSLNIFRFGWTSILLLGSMSLSSCSEEECNPDFTGNWAISEVCGGNNFNYTLTVSTGTGNYDLLFSNLGNLGPNSQVGANVNGRNFTIPSQTVQGENFSGEGSVSCDGLSIEMDWHGPDMVGNLSKANCSASGTKQ